MRKDFRSPTIAFRSRCQGVLECVQSLDCDKDRALSAGAKLRGGWPASRQKAALKALGEGKPIRSATSAIPMSFSRSNPLATTVGPMTRPGPPRHFPLEDAFTSSL